MADGQVHTIAKPRKAEPEPPMHAGLTAALIAAQMEVGAIVKDTKGARGNYAPLDAVLDAVRPVLNKHGIAFVQTPGFEGETMFVRTELRHVSGEVLDGVYPVCGIGLPPQQIGSALTYARRYSLLAICGVHPTNEDDDGEKGGERAPREDRPQEADPLIEFKANCLTRIAKCDDTEAVHKLWNKIAAGAGYTAMQAKRPNDAIALRRARDERLRELTGVTPVEADEIPY